MVEILAIDLQRGGTCRFDPEQRMADPQDILTVCSNLVNISTTTVPSDFERHKHIEVDELQLAHYSVKEYLTSDSVTGIVASFHIRTDPANVFIAEACLAYLSGFDETNLKDASAIARFPFAAYAAMFWSQHLRAAKDTTLLERANSLAIEMFSKKHALLTCVRLHNPDETWPQCNFEICTENIASPLY